MNELVIFVPYSIESTFRGSPKRALDIFKLSADLRPTKIVFRPSARFIPNVRLRSVYEHILFYISIFFLFITSPRSASFLCITQEPAFPFLLAFFFFSRKVTIDLHGIFLSEHRRLSRIHKLKFLGLRLFLHFESLVFSSSSFAYLFLAPIQKRYVQKLRTLPLTPSCFSILPFILPLPFRHAVCLPSKANLPPLFLYFGGVQPWQGLDILDQLILKNSPVLRFFSLHGLNIYNKYVSYSKLFDSVNAKDPDPTKFSYGFSFRSFSNKNSRFNFSSKISYYVANGIVPLCPEFSSEAPIVTLFGGSTFSFNPDCLESFVTYLISQHSQSYNNRLDTLVAESNNFFLSQQKIISDL